MTDNIANRPLASQGGTARRTLIHGAAWTIPVIAVAAAAPLAAASETPVCASASDISVLGYSSQPVDTPYNVTTSSTNPGYSVFQFQVGHTYIVRATFSFVYTGAAPTLASNFRIDTVGTNSFNWAASGVPTVTSSAGNVLLASTVPDGTSTKAAQSLFIASTAGPAGTVVNGDVITVTWDTVAIQNGTPGPTGSAFAFPAFSIRNCGIVMTGPNFLPPTTIPRAFNFYQFVL